MPSDSDYQPLPRTTPNNDYLRSIAEGLDGLVGDPTPAPVPAAASVEAILVPDLPTNNDYLKRIAEDVGELVARPSWRTLIVTCVTTGGAPVTGQTVTVREGGPDGHVIATAAYDGQPVSFALVADTAYHVSATPTLPGHLVPDTASGIVVDADVAATITYKAFADVSTAQEIQDALDTDIDLTLLVGEQISCTRGEQTLTWDVLGYDAANNDVTLAMSDCSLYPENQIFEPPQALAWFEDGLAAGAYSFRNFASNSAAYYFVLTTDIPAGGQLVADSSGFRTYASQFATTELETGTVSTTEVSGATYLGRAGNYSDPPYLNDDIRVSSGSSNFGESAILWLLNTDADAGTLRVPVTKFSRAYSYGVDGLLKGLDSEFLSCVAETDWKCACNDAYECPEELGGVANRYREPYTVRARFALLSYSEVRGTSGSGVRDEGAMLDAFVGASNSDLKRYRGNVSQNWFLRSTTTGPGTVRFMVPTNEYFGYSKAAKTACAIVPCCKIRGGDS